MPFGRKSDASGGTIDFNSIYTDLIRPAVDAAGMEPLRADEELVGGIIHKPMYERLIFCEYAVADLTTGNANVFYELGVRHAVRPYSTVVIASSGVRLPFDVSFLRAILYNLTADGHAADAENMRGRLTAALVEAKKSAVDSPLFQLVEGWHQPPLDHSKTDVFRNQVRYSGEIKEQLTAARAAGAQAVRDVELRLGDLHIVEAGVLIDLLLSYRAVKAWDDMTALVGRFPRPLADTTMVQEQLAFAYNRAGRGDVAEAVLRRVLETHGPSSETYGLLGRVYKDRWEAAIAQKNAALARGLLRQAIDSYVSGLEADWRDAYPGVNALTLMEVAEPPDDRRRELLPIVMYAVKRRIAAGRPDYWDYATWLELAVLNTDPAGADAALGDALAHVREPWEVETTARNLRLIRTAREGRGGDHRWIVALEAQLIAKPANKA
jgi:hypothetical protein